jgi:hypothetical protein
MLTGVIGIANARTLHFHCTFAHSFTNGVETNIDTDGDGQSAVLQQGIGNCSFARFLVQDETELTAPVPNTTCPAGTLEHHLVQGHSVFTEETGADQLFWQATSVTVCLDPSSSDLLLSDSGHGVFTGGTGKFAGATGTLDFQGVGKHLAFGFKNGIFGGFGQLIDAGSGTLILPHIGNGKDD